MPDPEFVRVLGYFALVAAAGFFVLFVANLRARFFYGARDLSFLGYLAGYSLVAGWGLVRLRKWAAVMLTVPLCLTGLVLGTLAVAKSRTVSAGIFALGWAALLSCPAVLAARAWRSLK
jgi:hypothetical protein